MPGTSPGTENTSNELEGQEPWPWGSHGGQMIIFKSPKPQIESQWVSRKKSICHVTSVYDSGKHSDSLQPPQELQRWSKLVSKPLPV